MNTTVATSMLDQLLHRPVGINLDGESYRLRDQLSLVRRRFCVIPGHSSHGCHADVGGSRSGCGGPFWLQHTPSPGALPRELECFARFADDAGVTLEHHSPDVCHAGAVFDQDAHVRIALDVGNFACPIPHTHDDVAAKAEVPKGYGVRKSIAVDGAQYRPAWAAIEIRLNLFVTEFAWHEQRLQDRNRW